MSRPRPHLEDRVRRHFVVIGNHDAGSFLPDNRLALAWRGRSSHDILLSQY